MVSQPLTVFAVNRAGANPSRPIALNVAASTKCASPAYSVRMSVGDSTSKRASPDVTADAAAPPLGAAADCAGTATADTATTAAASTGMSMERRRSVIPCLLAESGRTRMTTLSRVQTPYPQSAGYARVNPFQPLSAELPSPPANRPRRGGPCVTVRGRAAGRGTTLTRQGATGLMPVPDVPQQSESACGSRSRRQTSALPRTPSWRRRSPRRGGRPAPAQARTCHRATTPTPASDRDR